MSDFQIFNPIIKIHWAGWESDTLKLQSNGWQLSAEQDVSRQTLRFALRHPALEIFGLSDYIQMEYMRYFNNGSRYGIDSNFSMDINISFLTMDKHVKILEGLNYFQPINAEPTHMSMEIKSLDDYKIFLPINKPQHQIIIDPNDTQKMLSRILELQSPKQKEIRQKRNREINEFFRNESIKPKTMDCVFAEVLV